MFSKNVVKTVRETFGMGPLKGDFGIEYELESPRNQRDRVAWPDVRGFQIHNEGSIRGAEYVTDGPVTLDQSKTLTLRLRDVLAEHGNRPDMNAYRASTHVHLNMREDTLETVLGTVIAFTCIEPVFLRTAGSTRDGNLFCLSAYDSGDLRVFFESLCEHITYGLDKVWVTRGKYADLNLGRLNDLGTIEFRFFPTCLDPDKVHGWCSAIQSIRNHAREAKDKTFRELTVYAEKNPEAYVRSILGEPGLSVLSKRELEAYMDFGCETAYELTQALQTAYKEKEAKARKPKRPFGLGTDEPRGVQAGLIRRERPVEMPAPGIAGRGFVNVLVDDFPAPPPINAAPNPVPDPVEDIQIRPQNMTADEIRQRFEALARRR